MFPRGSSATALYLRAEIPAVDLLKPLLLVSCAALADVEEEEAAVGGWVGGGGGWARPSATNI